MKRTLAVLSAMLLAGFAAVSGAYEAIEVSNGGTISGKVVLAGDPPPRAKVEVSKDVEVCGKEPKLSEALIVGEDKGIQNAVVYLAGISKGKTMEPPAANLTLDQKGCWFHPHVMLFPSGTSVDVLNPDGVLHNFHTYSQANPPLNRAQPKFKKSMTVKFDKPEARIKVACDAHGWMSAYIFVQEHPYYTLTDASGAFDLTDVPAGEYELKVWHETLGESSQKVSVSAGGKATASFELAGK